MPKRKNESASKLEKVEKENLKNTSECSADTLIFRVFLLVTCVKILLIPTYHSTDFEVHRNWLAITHSLPITEWYTNAKSQWTLDYPPFFAWFEYLLSQFAVFFDAEMLKVDNLEYASSKTVAFQRATVIFADIVFAYGVREISKLFCKSHNSAFIFILLSLCNIGLLVVDHIHFQYNGFLLGILLLSITKVSEIWKQVSVLQGAMWFSILLNLKHIYLYVAPAYIVWLLKFYCLRSGQFFRRFFLLGIITLITLIISFGPFVNQLPQVISRLFPFKRGLVHAYWAANGWALYVGADKILSSTWKYLGWLNVTKSATMTGGLVQEESFTVLPTPTPFITFIITAVAMFPALYSLFNKKEQIISPKYFVRCVVLCALSSFMFGWHVHEKAILTAVIPLCTLAVTDREDARFFIILSSAGHTALLPLLYPSNLTPLKLFMLLLYTATSIVTLTRYFKHVLLYLHEWIYVCILPFLTIYETILHKLIFNEKLPFLPLALTSIYCAIGVSYTWLLYYYMFLCNQNGIDHQRKRKNKKKDVNIHEYKKRKML